MNALVADVGGTNARFGLVAEPGGSPEHVAALPTRAYPGLSEAAAAYLRQYVPDARIEAACLAIAGPVVNGRFRLNNAGWAADSAARVARALELPEVTVVNDFAALARSLPVLGPGDVRAIGPASPDARGVVAVVGPGTGLGTAGLAPIPGGHLPLPGEGGHADLPAATDEETAVLRRLRAEHGSVSAELVLCGAGLARLHGHLAALRGVPAEPLTAARICERQDDPLCAATLDMFCGLLGAFAGNVALTLGATGGVYLGGGILPRIADFLARSPFRTRFELKSPVSDYVAAIPTRLITHPCPALLGAAALLPADRAPAPPLEFA
ncbi:glucokinase [Actinomadura flavalba]|uniref:glucokinase n=1 Tax=Actinomadura flavalba TaxID=1120938 RepID=UPI00036D8A55|nr:glucokinase [Actinomadura flavalba]